MATIYSNTLKNTRMTATRDAIAGGTLQLLAGATVVSSHTLTTPGGTVTNGILTLEFDNAVVAATGTGTVTTARVRNTGDTDVITGLTVGSTGSGSDVIMQNTNVNSGQEIEITSATITHG